MALMQQFGDIFNKCKITLLTVLMEDVFSIFNVQCISNKIFPRQNVCLLVCLYFDGNDPAIYTVVFITF